MHHTDVVVVGAGIVGLAAAFRLLQQHPGTRCVVVDKESTVAFHQTGRNSGVIHSGIYYKPGSMKALNCRAGKQQLIEFCEKYGVSYEICGKVIVAVTDSEIPSLHRILERGKANGVDCRLINQQELKNREPHVAGVAAILVPETGIVDYPQMCERLADEIRAAGGEIRLQTRVTGIREDSAGCVVSTTSGDISCKCVVNCAGLQSDRVAKLSGVKVDAQIVPFRGEYFELNKDVWHFCRHLIYPVPDPKFPFLGVHFTRMVRGGVECGPNAVLAFAREGYKLTSVNPYDLFESLTYPGFVRMAAKHWRMGFGELWRSMSKAAFVRALQRLMPEIRAEHLHAAPAGVRAQAVGRDGSLVDDFLILDAARVINVCNAPSPAATASLNIGQSIVDRIGSRLN